MDYKNNNNNLRSVVNRVILYQMIQGLFAVAVIGLYQRNNEALVSGLCGFLLAVIPTFLYARFIDGRKVENYLIVYRKHKFALIVKYIANAVGFLLVFVFIKKISAGILFSVYIIALSGHLTSFILGNLSKK